MDRFLFTGRTCLYAHARQLNRSRAHSSATVRIVRSTPIPRIDTAGLLGTVLRLAC